MASTNLLNLKKVDDSTTPTKKVFTGIKRPEDLKRDKFLENINKYKNIHLNDVNNLINEIKENVKIGDNVVELDDNKYVYFNDLNKFYMILKMVISMILIKKKNMKKSLKILKKSSIIKKDTINI